MLAYLLLASALVIAACGLVYELVAGALASYLVGNTVTQFSTVIGTYLFSMGIGAWLAQYLRGDLLARFVALELLVGLIGGFSAALLFAAFAFGLAFGVVLYTLVALVGMLVGAEIPLLMRILRDRLEFSALISRVLSFDYLGALIAALAFPLWFVPRLGMIRTGLFFGIVNVSVAAATLYLLRREFRHTGLWTATAFSACLLLAGFAFAPRFSSYAETQLYDEPVVYMHQSPYQRIVITQDRTHTRLYLNQQLQFDTADEHRYHEALVHPLMATRPGARHVLVLGGGDGFAVRELLRYPRIESITLVDLDAKVTGLFRDHDQFARLNGHALRDRRVRITNADAWKWLEANSRPFDAVVIDLPDPSNFTLGKLYTTTFYRLLKRSMTPEAAIVLQATSPLFAREAYWCVVETLEAAGFRTTPYHAYVPAFGEWGFVLAGRGKYSPPGKLPQGLKFLTVEMLPGLFAFSPDMARLALEPNRLDNQILVQYYERAWKASLGG